ncbi:mechanosensitive ion channel domain-containing protein [Marinobacterium sediminicola]|uniref:Potassium efflux system protein n=1 Tax=Marinobacterium sediminicola TaxID=518898 RepID=A0ABY1S2D5_9GAMM|nr:mechanosensitive ion channel domain-containing protein [Marinobacterium sediminicola]ULG69504.1 mechanosensitive ion channel [Marinobacterium sediminicola]SMR75654.1 potassium efflux system protein [Marinobacterium sediminicola]
MTIRLLRLWLLLAGLLLTCTLTLAASPEETIQRLEQQLEQQQDSTGDQAALSDLYQRTLSALKSSQQYQRRAEELQQQLEQQPELLRRQQQTLEQAADPIKDSGFLQLDRPELEQAITLKRATLLQLEQQQEQQSQQIDLNEQKLLSLREQLAELKQTPPDLSALPAEQAGREFNDARLQLKNALQERRSSHIRALELELLALPGQTELARLQLEQLRRQVQQASLDLKGMLDRREQMQRDELESTLSSLTVPDETAMEHPMLTDLLQQNRELSEQLRQLIEHTSDAQHQRGVLERELDLITRSFKTIQQQLELESYSASYELRRFMQELSRPVDTADTRQALNALRLSSLDLNSLRQTDSGSGMEIADLTATQRRYQEQLQQNQQTLRDRLQENRQQLISELSQLLAVKEQLNERLQQARRLIEQQLLWLPVAPPVSWQWPGEVASGLSMLQQQLIQLFAQPLLARDAHLNSLLGFFALLLILSLATYRYQKQHRQRWRQELGNVVHDRFSRTLRLLLSGAIAALPAPALLLLLRSYSLNPDHPYHQVIDQLLLLWALSLQFYGMALIWLRAPDGLMNGHFSVPAPLTRVIRRQFHLLFWVSLPLLSLLLVTDSYNAIELQSGPGRLLFLLLVASLLLFWRGFWHVGHALAHLRPNHRWWHNTHLWVSLLILFNLAMFGLGLWGYTLTALFFMLILLVVILQFIGAFILFKLGLRWLLIEERRLAFSRARARRAEIIAARESKEETAPLKEDYLDLQTISDQSRVLLKTSIVLLLGVFLWLTLGDFLPTLQVLESVQLWSSLEQNGDQKVLTHVTLRDLVVGALIVWLSLLAAKNLPGLLELLALRHLDLSPGTGYAVTTLLKYSLILVGVMIAIGQFGVQWSKLQWLVAALGVGLGFGLQEIVANFVSGLIILFEKPVRIGDTVTLGNVTGTVSRIQIRATTITDWDRKEVIIPNKTFITEQLINWSLSDATTRVVITVGIAYGSDVELAEQLLLKAAQENERVLEDPAPDAYFREFADSTLSIDLRVFVSSMADRVPVTDELNKAINRMFNEHNIEIAFPQLDVHLHRSR